MKKFFRTTATVINCIAWGLTAFVLSISVVYAIWMGMDWVWQTAGLPHYAYGTWQNLSLTIVFIYLTFDLIVFSTLNVTAFLSRVCRWCPNDMTPRDTCWMLYPIDICYMVYKSCTDDCWQPSAARN